MDDRERDILNRIVSDTEDVEVPESLRPENIAALLEAEEAGSLEKDRNDAQGDEVIYDKTEAEDSIQQYARTKEAKEKEPAEKNVSQLIPKSANRRWKPSWTAGLAAACCLLVCGAVYGVQQFGMSSSSGSQSGTQADDSSSSKKGSAKSEKLSMKTADSYDDIYAYVKAYQEENYLDGGAEIGVYSEEAATDSATSSAAAAKSSGANLESSASAGSASSASATGAAPTQNGAAAEADYATTNASDYSTTNVRQEGVDEADIVKTDGRYIYTLLDNGAAVGIADTKDGLSAAGQIDTKDSGSIKEFYVVDGKLIIVCAEWIDMTNQSDSVARGWYGDRENTKILTYDIKDPENPKKVGEILQSGSYTSSRMSGDYLYLFSQYYCNYDVKKRDTQNYIPAINGKLIPESSIYLPYEDTANMYQVIVSVNINKPEEVVDSKAIFADYGNLYVSSENIYWYEQKWTPEEYGSSAGETTTKIRKIAYKDGELKAVAAGKIAGIINDSFSIDEYEGNLRVVTTLSNTNSVYVMDEEMETIGSIEGLAEEERVYSARFFGDTGYFVTFRQTDPLFTVDFSNPKEPKIIGELKIPGFSNYLHFYGKDTLLGIGMDADAQTGVTGGVKLSMFDISDSMNVKEQATYILENVYSVDAFGDYRTVLISKDKNLIGLSAQEEGVEKYFLFSYNEEKGFESLMEETINGSGYLAARGIYIKDVLYVVKGNIIESYSLKDYKKLDDLIM